MPKIIAHRGASGYRPEHSRSAYQLAFEMGVWAVEPDVQVSADGVLVVRHDRDLSTTTDVADRVEYVSLKTTKSIAGTAVSGWFVEDFTAAQLKSLNTRERYPLLRPESALHNDVDQVLLLSDLLELTASYANPVALVIELKDTDFYAASGLDPVPLLATLLQEYRGEVVIEAGDLDTLGRCVQAGISARRYFLIDRNGAPLQADVDAAVVADYRESSGLDLLAAGGELAGVVDGISVPMSVLLHNPFYADMVHDRGLEIFTWTARAENIFLEEYFRVGSEPQALGNYLAQWRRVVQAGVDAIFTDQPDLLARVWA